MIMIYSHHFHAIQMLQKPNLFLQCWLLLDLQTHVSNCRLDLSTHVSRTSQTYHGQSRTFNFHSVNSFFQSLPHLRKWHYLRKWDCLTVIELQTCEPFLTYPPPARQHSFHEQSPLLLPTIDSQVATLLVEAHQLLLDYCQVVSLIRLSPPSPCSRQSELLKT